MMTGSIQVHPTNLSLCMYNPARRTVTNDRLAAKRCLFGPSDPEVTKRLLREEDERNLKRLTEQYQIIDSSCPFDIVQVDGTVPDSTVAPTVESARAVLQVRENDRNSSESMANVIHSEVRLTNVEVATSAERPTLENDEAVEAVEGASENPSETFASSAEQSEQSAPRNPSSDRRVQRNPGTLRYFPARRRYYEPYARKVEQESRTTGV